MSEGVQKRKLIEVALPLEAINKEAAREKSIRHGHPSTLHLWWSRKPLAAARAVLFAQLVDDPSSHPDLFPSEEAQKAERNRLHALIERMVVWENTQDPALLDEVRAEILRSTGGNPPPLLDPFSGGGSIPLEAQRLGLEGLGTDLNPVAVLITKALIEIPPRFSGSKPVFSELEDTRLSWNHSDGLAADLGAYGVWVREQVSARIGHHFPVATLPDGTKTNVVAWIWARTVTCPNPACGIEMPLTSKWWLHKKPGKEAYIHPQVITDPAEPSGKRVGYEVRFDSEGAPTNETDGSMRGRRGATCVACGSSVNKEYIKERGKEGLLGVTLMAIVAEGKRRRNYLPPSREHLDASCVSRPTGILDEEIATHSQYMGAPQWGLTSFSDLYLDRQLLVLSTFSDVINETREKVLTDALKAGWERGERLNDGGVDAEAYADAISVYLSLVLGRLANLNSALTTWMSDRGALRETFARQALPMSWDIAEANPLSESGGGWLTCLDKVAKVVERLNFGSVAGESEQIGAIDVDMEAKLISTDPPYYDNIPYADLSDFFYVWLRRTIGSIYPGIFGTVLVPKSEELVANHVRQGGRAGAKKFFEMGFRKIFSQARENPLKDFPITVYYAFKQSDIRLEGEASTGWETLLEGMIGGGWEIRATWPMRTEGSGRIRAIGANALASSIVLTLRPRPNDAPVTDRRNFLGSLESELPVALRDLQEGHIAPVDLPQAAIGPGMAVFSRYSRVIEADGSQMSVRSALAQINEILDRVLNEQEGDFDSTTRFAIAWYRQHGYATGTFGDANNIATARNVTVESMAQSGVLESAAGKVTLIAPPNLPEDYNPELDDSISAWEVLQHMVRLLDTEGIAAAGQILKRAGERRDDPVDADLVKELAFLLFSLAEKNGWTKDAIAFNSIATSWPDIIDASRDAGESQITQATLDIEEE